MNLLEAKVLAVTTTTTHECDHALGRWFKEVLAEWAGVEPESCRAIQPISSVPDFYAFQVTLKGSHWEIGCAHPWTPSEVEFAIIDRAVQVAAEKRGWRSTVSMQAGNAELVYVGSMMLDIKGLAVAQAECCERTIARLLAYLAACRGEY